MDESIANGLRREGAAAAGGADLTAQLVCLASRCFGEVLAARGKDDARRRVDGDRARSREAGLDGLGDEAALRADARDQEPHVRAHDVASGSKVCGVDLLLLRILGVEMRGTHNDAGVVEHADLRRPEEHQLDHERPVRAARGHERVLHFPGVGVAGATQTDERAAGVLGQGQRLERVLAHVAAVVHTVGLQTTEDGMRVLRLRAVDVAALAVHEDRDGRVGLVDVRDQLAQDLHATLDRLPVRDLRLEHTGVRRRRVHDHLHPEIERGRPEFWVRQPTQQLLGRLLDERVESHADEGIDLLLAGGEQCTEATSGHDELLCGWVLVSV